MNLADGTLTSPTSFVKPLTFDGSGADSFRIAAYRRAADSVRALDNDLGTIAENGGRKALEAITGVGASIADAIAEMLTTGRWPFSST